MNEKLNRLKCFLLIDDDEATNFYHKIIIKEVHSNVYIQSVESAKEGLDFLLGKGDYVNAPHPNIIFLDINMPGMSGWDFLDEYKKLSKEIQDQSIIVMLTSSINLDDREKAATISTINEFENKPLTTEALNRIIEKNFT